MATGWEHVERDGLRDRQRGHDERLQDPILGPLIRGHVRRDDDDEDEEG